MPKVYVVELSERRFELEMEKWKKGDILWLVIAILLVLGSIVYKHIAVLNTVTPFVIASDIAALFGVTYVILVAKQDRRAYLFGIVNVILYALAVYGNGLYISAAYNILYSFPVLIYGYIHWGKMENSGDNGVKEFGVVGKIVGVLLMAIAVIGLALFSEKVLGGTNVWMDSIVSVCVCVATFLLTQKYIEQWLLFVISNFLGIVLFFPKNFSDMGNIDLFTMWFVYFINSIYGYVTWKKSLRKD